MSVSIPARHHGVQHPRRRPQISPRGFGHLELHRAVQQDHRKVQGVVEGSFQAQELPRPRKVGRQSDLNLKSVENLNLSSSLFLHRVPYQYSVSINNYSF